MKSKIAYFFMLILCCTSVHAQQVHLGPLHSSDNPREDWLLPGDTIFNLMRIAPMQKINFREYLAVATALVIIVAFFHQWVLTF